MIQDHYAVLGIALEATDEDIRRAYRDMAFRYHPDHNHSLEANDKFLQLTESYRVLGDSESRRQYNLQYQKYFGTPDQGSSSSTAYASLSHVRMKRASRYSRGSYSQRLRYRSAAFSHEAPSEPIKASPHEDPERQPYSSYYQARVDAEMEGAAKGFGYYAQVVRIICLGISVFILFLATDRYMAKATEAEQVEKMTPMPWSISDPGTATVSTSLSEFHIHGSFVHMLPKGKSLKIEKTPFLHVPVRIFFVHEGSPQVLTTHGGIYGPAFYFSLLVLCAALATIFLPKNPEINAYLGTITILMAVVILSIMLA